MAVPAKPTIAKTGDVNLDRVQFNLAQAMGPLLDSPLAGCVLIPGVVLAVGSTTVGHGLGRRLRGWWPVRQRGAANIYDAQDANTAPDRTLVLVSDAAVTIDLVVF